MKEEVVTSSLAPSTMDNNEEVPPDCHLRLCVLSDEEKDCYGFHLSRTQWDPYPWVTGVEAGSPAEEAGLQPGDCVLEVNEEDVLGEKISQVAARMKSAKDGVRLLLWNPGPEHQTTTNDVFTSPTPASILKFSSCLQSVMLLMECPVCLETIPPPAHQCCNGHLICRRCQSKSDRCPVCRVHFSRTRSLFADQVISTIRDTFGLALKTEAKSPVVTTKLKHRLFFFKRHSMPSNSSSSSSTSSTTSNSGKKSQSTTSTVQMVVIPTNINTAMIGREPETASLTSSSTVTNRPRSSSKAEAITAGRGSRLSHSSDLHRQLSSGGVELSSSLNTKSNDGEFSASTTPENLSDDDNNSQQDFVSSSQQEEYYCPIADACSKVNGPYPVLLKHLQTQHEGPVIQYFSSRFTLHLPSELHLSESTITSLTTEGKTFFLKFIEDKSSNQTLVWAWIIGDEEDAKNFMLEVTLQGSNSDNRANLCTSVLSLASLSSSEIVTNKNCIIIDENLFNRYSKVDAISGRKRLETVLRIHALNTELSDDL